jgi:hypothetical protein
MFPKTKSKLCLNDNLHHNSCKEIVNIFKMLTDWTQLGNQLGSIHRDGESGGNDLAEQAFEEILGQDWIKNTVDHIVSFKSGTELAMNCLQLIRSKQAVEYAYYIYKSSEGDKTARAVWLIKHMAHPISFNWIEEFLNDANVMEWGIGVLDQLLWTEQVPFDEKVKSLLASAESKRSEQLQGQVNFIRDTFRRVPGAANKNPAVTFNNLLC